MCIMNIRKCKCKVNDDTVFYKAMRKYGEKFLPIYVECSPFLCNEWYTAINADPIQYGTRHEYKKNFSGFFAFRTIKNAIKYTNYFFNDVIIVKVNLRNISICNTDIYFGEIPCILGQEMRIIGEYKE